MSSFHNQDTVHTQAGVLNQHGHNYHAPVYMGVTPQPQPPWTSGNIYWLVPRAVNGFFTGRHSVIERIEKAIKTSLDDKDRTESSRLVITGMGGQGKSETCLRVASRLRHSFWGVFWIDLQNAATAEAGFITVSKLIKQPAEKFDEARQTLENIQYPWLIVLDNADDPNIDYQQYLPFNSSAFILVTSRNMECAVYENAGHEILDGLDEGDGEELLLKASRIPQSQRTQYHDDAYAVCTLLASHPLALIQAGAYISQRHCSLAQYPDIYKTHRQRLLRFRPAQAQSRYQDVYATLDISVEYLGTSSSEEAKDALQLLSMLSMLASTAIPFKVFESAASHLKEDGTGSTTSEDLTPWLALRLPPVLQKEVEEWDPFRLTRALHQLKSLALVHDTNKDGQLTWLYMHSLTHVWARDRQDVHMQRASWIAAGSVLVLSSIMDADILWYQYSRQLLPHIRSFLAFNDRRKYVRENRQEMMVIDMMTRCGSILRTGREYKELYSFAEEMFEDLDHEIYKPSVRLSQLFYQLASSYLYNDKREQGVEILERQLERTMKSVAEDRIMQLESQDELADAYLLSGQLDKAVKMLEHIVDSRTNFFPKDSDNLQTARWRLARAYRRNGQHGKSVELLELVVQRDERELSENNIRTQASRHELSKAYSANGNFFVAVKLLEKVVSIDQQTLPTDHRDCLGSQYHLAFAYKKNGQLNDAIETMERVVQATARLMDEDLEKLNSRGTLVGWQQEREIALLTAVSPWLEEDVSAPRTRSLYRNSPH